MITLTFSDGGLSANLTNAPNVTGVQLQKWMDRVVKYVSAAVTRNIGNGGLIGRRTGNLARAIQSLVTITGTGEVVGTVWPDTDIAPYGDIQEDGGTIVPTHAQALTVPLAAMLTPNGVARGTAAQVRESPASFGFASTFIGKKDGNGAGVIYGRPLDRATGWASQREAIVPLFALKTSVTIPATHYLSTSLTQSLAWIQDELERMTQEDVSLIFGNEAAA